MFLRRGLEFLMALTPAWTAAKRNTPEEQLNKINEELIETISAALIEKDRKHTLVEAFDVMIATLSFITITLKATERECQEALEEVRRKNSERQY